MANPFICNCRLTWLREWLKNSNLATGNPKCSSPDDLRDRSVANTNDLEFVCSAHDQDQECHPSTSTPTSLEIASVAAMSENHCPVNCTCVNDIVRCSHLSLKQIPSDIPTRVKELYAEFFSILF